MHKLAKRYEITETDVEIFDEETTKLREIVNSRATDSLLVEELRGICMNLLKICPRETTAKEFA